MLVESQERIIQLQNENKINLEKLEFYETEDKNYFNEIIHRKDLQIKELNDKIVFLKQQLDLQQDDYEKKVNIYENYANNTISERFSEMSAKFRKFEE